MKQGESESIPVTFFDVVSQRSAGRVLHEYIQLCFRFVMLDWVTHIQAGGVTVDGNVADPFQLIEAGQALAISINDYQEKPVDTQWKLLWQGQDIFAVHKPAGLPVHRTPMHIYNTLIEVVKRESEWPDAHLLHRLDTDTAGVLLLGKNKVAAMKWQPKLKSLMQKKFYHAVVYGKPSWHEYDMQCGLQTREDSVIKAQMYVTDIADKAKFSHSFFRVLSSNGVYSLIECEIFTGRKHQIRAQLSHLGHAIVGDKIYSNQGRYYLKRLNKSLTLQDESDLKTRHHLLLAQRVILSLSGLDTDVINIKSPYYSSQWLQFCLENELSLN